MIIVIDDRKRVCMWLRLGLRISNADSVAWRSPFTIAIHEAGLRRSSTKAPLQNEWYVGKHQWKRLQVRFDLVSYGMKLPHEVVIGVFGYLPCPYRCNFQFRGPVYGIPEMNMAPCLQLHVNYYLDRGPFKFGRAEASLIERSCLPR